MINLCLYQAILGGNFVSYGIQVTETYRINGEGYEISSLLCMQTYQSIVAHR